MPAVYLMHSYCVVLKEKRAWRGLQNDIPNVVEEGTLIPTAQNACTDLFSDLISSAPVVVFYF